MNQKKKKGEDGATPPVRLLTIHSSKGLEFSNVAIIACENKICPHSESNKEEERRLFYVAMTRACNNLILSYSFDNQDGPSVFLKEAGLL